MREVRRAAIQAQKNCKETLPRARRLTKEMMLYWKKYDKVEKEHRKRAEKEALEQRKLDEEMREVGWTKVVGFLFSFSCKKHSFFCKFWQINSLLVPTAGKTSAAKAELSHHPDGAVRSLHEWQSQHWGRGGGPCSGGDTKEAGGHLGPEADRHRRRCDGQRRAGGLRYEPLNVIQKMFI